NRDLLAAESPGVEARGDKPGVQQITGTFGESKCADQLTRAKSRQVLLLLEVAARQKERFGREVDGRREGNRSEGSPDFLRNQDKLEIAETRPPVLFGHRGTQPAHLRGPLPKARVIGLRGFENGATDL